MNCANKKCTSNHNGICGRDPEQCTRYEAVEFGFKCPRCGKILPEGGGYILSCDCKNVEREAKTPFADMLTVENWNTKSPGAGMAALQRMIHKNAVDHGWWETERPLPEILMLIVTELAEAMEGYRNHDDENVKEELADTVIRILDYCEHAGIDLGSEIVKKHKKNIERPYRHGGKRC